MREGRWSTLTRMSSWIAVDECASMSNVKAASYRVGVRGESPRPAEVLDAPELSGAERVTRVLAPGLWATMPTVFEDPDHDGLIVRLLIDFTPEGIRPVGVTVMQQDGSPVTGQTMRAVRVAEVFENAAAYVIHAGEVDESGRRSMNPVGHPAFRLADELTTEQGTKAARDGAGSSDFMERIAALYEVATITGLPPQKFVMDVFNAPRSTAGYWISQARKRGFLAPVSEAGANG